MTLSQSAAGACGHAGRLENGGCLLMDSTLAISEMGFVPLDLIEFLVLY